MLYAKLHSSLWILDWTKKEIDCPYRIERLDLPKFTEEDWLYMPGQEQSYRFLSGMDLDYLPPFPIQNPLSHYRVFEIAKFENPHFGILKYCKFCHDSTSSFSFEMTTVFDTSFLVTPFEKTSKYCKRYVTISPTYVPQGGCRKWLYFINEVAGKIDIDNMKQYRIKRHKFILKALSATLSVSTSFIQ